MVSFAVPAGLWGCDEAAEDSDTGGETVTAEQTATADMLDGETTYTFAAPDKWVGKEATHAPIVEFQVGEGTVEVFTNHDMLGDHWIEYQYIRDQDGKLVGFIQHENTASEARVKFSLSKDTTSITAYSHCNQHDHWKGELKSVG